MNIKPTVISYIAGIFDGEGCVCVSCADKTHPERIKQRRERYFSLCSITNTSMECLKFVQRYFGGKIYGHSEGCFRWYLSGSKEQIKFLRMIQPYLIIKKIESFLAIAFLQTIRPVNLGGIKINHHVRKARQWFFKMIQLEKDKHSVKKNDRRSGHKTISESKIIETAGNPERAISNEANKMERSETTMVTSDQSDEGIVRHSEESEINRSLWSGSHELIIREKEAVK